MEISSSAHYPLCHDICNESIDVENMPHLLNSQSYALYFKWIQGGKFTHNEEKNNVMIILRMVCKH